MPDKKCPNCGLWNSEKAQVCDCGYNFIQEKVDMSNLKEEEYRKIFSENKLGKNKIRAYHKEILIRIFISLTIAYGLLALAPFFKDIGINTLIPSIFLLLIISSNFFTGIYYLNYLMKKIWKYPVIGIVAGWIFSQIVNMVVISIWMIRTGGLSGEFTFGKFYPLVPITLIYLCSLIGLYIGKNRVIKDIEKYA